ncbi:membrane protein insertase YidC [Biformimicrobium ophioploci]|uniref:Membrane protein insertase YidC n=1 Tax=Biformimicrobium ophioploci TaxID=3036711 RepID=A0ABQ6LVC8_9GAMM|nr:membrane protein insertase YidC [Microbulbifer sp. NKW57]
MLLGGIAACIFGLIIQWNKFQESHKPVVDQETVISQSQQPAAETLPAAEAPAVAEDGIPEVADAETAGATDSARKLVRVRTDVLELLIDTQGGDIVKAALPQHYEEIDTPDRPLILLNQTRDHTYIARSGLLDGKGQCSAGRPLFSTDQDNYVISEGQDSLVVDLKQQVNGLNITKRYTLKRGDYLINTAYLVENTRDRAILATLCGDIRRDSSPAITDAGVGVRPFLGGAMRTEEKQYFKQDLEEIAEKSSEASITGGWIAMVQHYFISAWVPDAEARNSFKMQKLPGKDLFSLGFSSTQTRIDPNTSAELSADFYVGPKDVYRLEEISPSLDLTVDYGWLWWIAKPLFRVLNWIHDNIIANWGWSIILLTVLIKALLYPLSAAGMRSMAKMRKFAPQMKALQEQHKGDRQKLAEATMKLYRKEKINPMGGCLPILLQIPVFIALYWMLMESVELRHAPWIGWIQDLSIKDPYFVLPLIMGVSMWFQQKLQPQPTDPTQAKIMQMMPIMMTFFFLWFPAGLVIYWIANNLITIAQTWVINKQVEAAEGK